MQAERRSARERLLDAAEDLFYGHGIGRTGVDAVLAQAQVSTATLYAQFGGKDGLITAYLQRRLERWEQTWEECITAATTPEDRLLAIFDALAEFRTGDIPDRGCAFLATAAELPSPDHPAHAVITADTEHLCARLRGLAADTGAPDPDTLAGQVRLTYDGALAAFLRPTISDPITAARQLAATAIHAATTHRS